MSLFWGSIAIIGSLASVIGVVVAWLAKKAADDAKKAVENARVKLEKKRDVKGLEAVCESAMSIQEMLRKYFTSQKGGLEDGNVGKDADSLDKFITHLNNEKDLIKNEAELNISKSCQKLKLHLEGFKKGGDESFKAAEQIRSVVDKLVPKIKKVVKKNEFAD